MATKSNKDEIGRIGRPQLRAVVASGSLELMNQREIAAISNLVDWVAAEQDTTPEDVKNFTAARFGPGEVRDFARNDYDDVIRFLMDLRIDEMRDLPAKPAGERGHHV